MEQLKQPDSDSLWMQYELPLPNLADTMT